jgi:hypothetical protein
MNNGDLITCNDEELYGRNTIFCLEIKFEAQEKMGRSKLYV